MGLTMEMRKGFARETAKRYRQGSKKKKGQLIEEYMELAGCTRHHAAWMLRCWGIKVWEQRAGRPVKIVVEVGVRATPGGAPPAPLRVVGSPLG